MFQKLVTKCNDKYKNEAFCSHNHTTLLYYWVFFNSI